MLDIECIVRGYLAGSAYKEYERRAPCTACPCRPGSPRRPPARADLHPLDQGDRGPRREHRVSPRRPTWSAGRRPTAAAELCLAAYRGRRRAAEEQGIVIATPSSSSASSTARSSICDEVLTPDSSRFWPADDCAPGHQPALVRQAAPARLARGPAAGTSSRRPRPSPTRSWRATSQRYVDAYERICGRSLADWYGA